jgi:hypothetical protein
VRPALEHRHSMARPLINGGVAVTYEPDQLPSSGQIIQKTMRLNAQTATIESGLVFLPTQAPWLLNYVAEMTSFPKGKHSDQVDSTSQALEWVKKALYGPGMWGCSTTWRSRPRRRSGGGRLASGGGALRKQPDQRCYPRRLPCRAFENAPEAG